MGNAFGVKVGEPVGDLPEGDASGMDIRVGLEVVEETASVGVLEDEDVVGVGCWLLIGFITLKGNFLAISETLDHISMMDGLQQFKLILEM